jgi:hypothetical protein
MMKNVFVFGIMVFTLFMQSVFALEEDNEFPDFVMAFKRPNRSLNYDEFMIGDQLFKRGMGVGECYTMLTSSRNKNLFKDWQSIRNRGDSIVLDLFDNPVGCLTSLAVFQAKALQNRVF